MAVEETSVQDINFRGKRNCVLSCAKCVKCTMFTKCLEFCTAQSKVY